MKKIIAFALAFAVATVFFCGCTTRLDNTNVAEYLTAEGVGAGCDIELDSLGIGYGAVVIKGEIKGTEGKSYNNVTVLIKGEFECDKLAVSTESESGYELKADTYTVEQEIEVGIDGSAEFNLKRDVSYSIIGADEAITDDTIYNVKFKGFTFEVVSGNVYGQ